MFGQKNSLVKREQKVKTAELNNTLNKQTLTGYVASQQCITFLCQVGTIDRLYLTLLNSRDRSETLSDYMLW